MKRTRTIQPPPVKRERTLLEIPRTPGGFLDNPPEGCPHVRDYRPNPRKHKGIKVVDYVLCSSSCKLQKSCERKTEEDSGAKRRIRNRRDGIGEED